MAERAPNAGLAQQDIDALVAARRGSRSRAISAIATITSEALSSAAT